MKIITFNISVVIIGASIDPSDPSGEFWHVNVSENDDWCPADWPVWLRSMETVVLHATYSYIKGK